MPAQHAQQGILNCPANFSAELWGDDEARAPGLQVSPHGSDDFRTWLPITYGPVVTSQGLSVAFGKRLDWSVLNEDNGTDEVYVLIKFTDCAMGPRQIMVRTIDIVHNF
jgi:hypothetical protein